MSNRRGMLTNFAALIDPNDPFRQLAINADGSINVRVFPGAADLSLAIINFNGAGDQTIVAGVAGQAINIYRLFLIVGGNTSITFKDGTNTDGPMPLVANEAIVLTLDSEPWFTGANAAPFVINSSSPVQVSGRAYYLQA